MPPKIYAANVEDVGKPIADDKSRTPKQDAAAEKAKLRRQAKKQTVTETPEAVAPVPVDEKAKAPRKRKQVHKETESNLSEGAETLVDGESKKPKKQKDQKEVLKVKESKESVLEDVKVKVKVKKPRVKIEKIPEERDEAPKWFKSYIMGVKEEQSRMSALKIPKKQVRFEADQEAAAKWCEPVTRERVNRTVDNHMQSMYSMVFPNRKF